MRHDTRFASDSHGATRDWVEFLIQDGDEKKRFRIDVSFMLSNYSCMYGHGCPSVLMRGATNDGGCCQLGVMLTEDDVEQVQAAIQKMEPDDADNYTQIKEGSWYRKHDDDDYNDEYPWHTRTKGGLCIMSNRVDGPTGKPGCSLHALASRLGVNHSETKPVICWQIPLSLTVSDDVAGDVTLYTLTATPGNTWGASTTRNPAHIGWWCTETADAYGHTGKPVYITNEVELRKMIGDMAYEQMALILQKIEEEGGRRAPMPGETYAGGQKMIPLMVLDRAARWQASGDKVNLARSQRYFKENNTAGLYDPYITNPEEEQ